MVSSAANISTKVAQRIVSLVDDRVDAARRGHKEAKLKLENSQIAVNRPHVAMHRCKRRYELHRRSIKRSSSRRPDGRVGSIRLQVCTCFIRLKKVKRKFVHGAEQAIMWLIRAVIHRTAVHRMYEKLIMNDSI